ncbi:amidohydrolase family protein [Streptomyces sp. A7024]|uniref:Amidohydrolase family protein n=1 Tax=Streptomyces coryli TaxID=1128680 RepID=A0A6G4TSR4_9ACTN|nr:amidohydrolase family protein [Streptomyces coryli]NGN62506.1 amidohydrolase family protein [Streptomyces coryli]
MGPTATADGRRHHQKGRGRTVIRNVRLFDGERTTPRASVLIDGDRIAGLHAGLHGGLHGGHAEVVVDGSGKTLLPGLIDGHTHVDEGSLAQALRFGVTTELDMFCLPETLTAQRKLAAERDDVADLRSAGVLATAPGGHPSHLVPGVEFDTVAHPGEAAGFVADRVAAGSDYLKIVIDGGVQAGTPMPKLSPDTVAALVHAGKAAGLRTIAHAITLQDIEVALDAGIDGLAHVFCDTGPQAERMARRIAAQGVFVASTLAYFEAVDLGAENAVRAARTLRRAGACVLAGTDATPATPAHGSAMHRELVLLTDAGFGNEEALAAATSAPARRFGLTDRGRIAPGLRADLLLVHGDPTTDITATSSIAGVWRGGVRRAPGQHM